MCVNNLPRVALDNGAVGIRTRDLLIASPTPCRYAIPQIVCSAKKTANKRFFGLFLAATNSISVAVFLFLDFDSYPAQLSHLP